jgi:hypothetical protein
MGQLIACAVPEGILVASDSRAELFDVTGEERFINLERLIPIAPHALIASAGAEEGHDLCQQFASFAKDEGLADIDALIEAAPAFFVSRYDEVMRKICEVLPTEPLHSMYLLLAGYSQKTPNNPNRLFIMWNRAKPPKIEANHVTPVFTMPRRMGLEFKLNQLVTRKAPLQEVVALARQGMEKLAAKDEYIGPPYHYLTVTAAGVSKP